jgi:excisionase family DNA binding protein
MKRNDQHDKVYGSVDELAKTLKISRSVAYQGLNSGAIPGIRLGKRFIIPRAAIQEWLRNAGNLAGSRNA